MSHKQPHGWATVATAAEFLDLTPQAIRQTYVPKLAADDIDRSRPAKVRVSAVVDLIVRQRVEEAIREPTGDPMLDGDSPALERYRLAKAKHAELDLALRKGELVERDTCRAVLARWAVLIRRMGDRLAKRHGNEAALAVNSTLEECGEIIAEFTRSAGE